MPTIAASTSTVSKGSELSPAQGRWMRPVHAPYVCAMIPKRITPLLVLFLGIAGAAHAQSERAGIEALRQRDIAATLTQNPDQLAALWDDDATLLGQGEHAIVGLPALRAVYATGGQKCLTYTPHFESLHVNGSVAYEWGRFDVTFEDVKQKTTATLHGRFLRVMKKQRDGSWRFTRIMWQEDPEGSAAKGQTPP